MVLENFLDAHYQAGIDWGVVASDTRDYPPP
jgi:hypothetical protein